MIAGLGGAAAAWPLAARAQQANQARRIGVLMGPAESDPEAQSEITVFRRALQDLGWAGDRNVRIAYRWSAGDPDRNQTFAKELVALRPDVIFATTTPAAAALLRESRTVSIVFVRVADPVGDGFVANLAKPGGSATGFTNFEASLVGKWLELLKEIAPGIVRVTAMFNPTTSPAGGLNFLPIAEAAAASIAIELKAAAVHDVAEIERVIAAVAREPNSGLVPLPDIFLNVHRELIIEQTTRYRVPAIYQYRYFVTGGGLISYGPDVIDQYALAASYVDRILKGQKPADLPVQLPTKYELVINLKTAKALGLTYLGSSSSAPTRFLSKPEFTQIAAFAHGRSWHST
jgi:putative ABC transport system substrate-binding protein